MKIRISIQYNTSWGEQVVLAAGRKVYPMEFTFGGLWQAVLPGSALKDGQQYGFRVVRGGDTVRSEWRKHRFTAPATAPKDTLILRERWIDRPANSAFWSSAFTDVIFRREDSTDKPWNDGSDKPCIDDGRHAQRMQGISGNLTLRVPAAEVRPGEAVGIVGSGKDLGEWKKVRLLSDAEFPWWSIRLDVKEPFSYKFVIADRRSGEIRLWENGTNHYFAEVPGAGVHVVDAAQVPVFPTLPWRGAGVAVPVFSLRTEDGFGVGEFNDIKKLVDWAEKTGQNFIQLLPVNDTTMTHKWQDSYPYNAVSSFALHPQFLNLQAIGIKADAKFKARRAELNALPKIDYEAVNNEKLAYARKAFEKTGAAELETPAYKAFVEEDKIWLLPYAAFCVLRDLSGTADFSKWGSMAKYSPKKLHDFVEANRHEVDFYCWLQYQLDIQLKDAVAYAHKHNVALKGDLPIGVSRTSADAWTFPELFHMDSQAGAPPDAFSVNGQNWGFPTYNWEKMAETGFAWWKARLRKMNAYFDAFRIDHILGFFRIWEIPLDAVHGLLGHFNPALPYSADELRGRGFDVSGGAFVTPLISDWVLEEIFGDLAGEVRTKYIRDGKLIPAVDTQRKVVEKFTGDDEKSRRLRDGLMGLLEDVLFIEDPRHKGYYHPRISGQFTLSFRCLDGWLKDSFNALYNEFFYRRHNDFWKDSAYRKLPSLLRSTGMLACGEDLGMIPDCVPDTMADLNILSLEIQRMPKAVTETFGNPASYPYWCVCATGTHDTSPLRAWWEEDREATQLFYNTMLHEGGEAPYFCEPWVAERIVRDHMNCPAMLTILPLQDYLATDGEVRFGGDPAEERINVPAIPRYYWRYRLHCTIESLLANENLCGNIRAMILGGGRGR